MHPQIRSETENPLHSNKRFCTSVYYRLVGFVFRVVDFGQLAISSDTFLLHSG